MKLLPQGSWGYAVLMVLLFSIAAIATKEVIDFVTERVQAAGQNGESTHEFGAAIWLLTMGLMFLAGALGLLAVSTVAEQESRHRITRIVNSMNHLPDGLLAVDYQGIIRGANSSARKLALNLKKKKLPELFPLLKLTEMQQLLNPNIPAEIETEHERNSNVRMLRLRSQPAEGLVLVFVSDITENHASKLRQQQASKLQILGRLSAGVAHDFSNILCAISGHASIIQRMSDDKTVIDGSVSVIQEQSDRGVRLSRQLLQLCRSSGPMGRSCESLADCLREAGELLKVGLTSKWNLSMQIEGPFPVVPFSHEQIVQIALNLALLASDSLAKPGSVSVRAFKPDPESKDLKNFAVIMTISASTSSVTEPEQSLFKTIPDASASNETTGVIPSVIRALIDESGGRLDELYASSVKCIYRVCMPHASVFYRSLITPLRSVISGQISMHKWNIFIVGKDSALSASAAAFEEAGAKVSALASPEEVFDAARSGSKPPDVIIADWKVFGNNAVNLFRAMHDLYPAAGVVMLSEGQGDQALQKEPWYIHLEHGFSKDALLDALVRSRTPASG